MTDKLIMANGDGMKSINPWDTDAHPEAWTWLSGQPMTKQNEFYSTVAAVFRAFNLKANTVASMPFTLYSVNGEEYDNSNEWENKVGFLPNPQELLRLATLSYITTNTIYQLKTSNILGERVKGLYHAIPTSFTPYVNPATQELDYILRVFGMTQEKYTPDDKRLVRMWRLDHTTEVLPSQATEAKAVMSSAGIMHYQDAWVEYFYRRGGIKATLIAMKGAVNPDKKDDEEKKWSNWFKGVGQWFGKPARVINAETVDVKTVGAGVDDIKDNKIYENAIANIAMGTGMPLSLLLANSSNYATAQEEKATWYESDIIPLCRWLAYEYNRQLWGPLGLYMAFQPQTLDPNQQDETEKAAAVNQYMDLIAKVPTLELFIGLTDTMGIEVSDTLLEAVTEYYADKQAKVESGELGPDGQPIEVQPVDNTQAVTEDDKPVENPPAKWLPTINELNELRVWQDVAVRRFKKGQPLDFKYEPHYGGLSGEITQKIETQLLTCKTLEEVKAAFDISGLLPSNDGMLFAPEVKANADIITLADSLNKLADALERRESDK